MAWKQEVEKKPSSMTATDALKILGLGKYKNIYNFFEIQFLFFIIFTKFRIATFGG